VIEGVEVVSYARPQRLAHWASVTLVAGLVAVGLVMTSMPDGDAKLRVYTWHEWMGLTLAAVTAVRLWLRARVPAPPIALPWHEAVLRRLVHGLVYVLLVATPTAGWLMTQAFGFSIVYLGVLPIPSIIDVNRERALQLQWAHWALATALVALIAAHLGAIVKHHLVDRDGIMKRMWP
jgi:cytochrome b561